MNESMSFLRHVVQPAVLTGAVSHGNGITELIKEPPYRLTRAYMVVVSYTLNDRLVTYTSNTQN